METNCASLEEYCALLEQNKNEGKIFSDSLHVNFSEFFRNNLTFAVLERIVLPGLGRQQKKLNIELPTSNIQHRIGNGEKAEYPISNTECPMMRGRRGEVLKSGEFTERHQLGGIAPHLAGREDEDCRQVVYPPRAAPKVYAPWRATRASDPVRRRELRIWSAACAGGQEAYSLAILLEELKNGGNEKFNCRIFATDQNESQINEARKGQYSATALNNLNLKRVNRWFTKHGETYTVKTELKENIDFSVFDLFSEKLSSPPRSIFGDFDLVFCANLLFYYKDEYRKIILEKAGNSLASGGFLVVGEAEMDILINYGCREVFPQSGIFRK